MRGEGRRRRRRCSPSVAPSFDMLLPSGRSATGLDVFGCSCLRTRRGLRLSHEPLSLASNRRDGFKVSLFEFIERVERGARAHLVGSSGSASRTRPSALALGAAANSGRSSMTAAGRLRSAASNSARIVCARQRRSRQSRELRDLNAIGAVGGARVTSCRKTSSPFQSATRTVRLTSRGSFFVNCVSSWKCVANSARERFVLVQMLDHRPGDRQPVERRGAAPDLVENDERAPRRLIEDRGGLDHLDHEGRAAAGEIVGRADAREQPVDDADMRVRRRHGRCPSAPGWRSARSAADRWICPPCSGR